MCKRGSLQHCISWSPCFKDLPANYTRHGYGRSCNAGKRSLIIVMALLRLCSHDLCSLQYDLQNDESYAPDLHLHMGLIEHGMLDG